MSDYNSRLSAEFLNYISAPLAKFNLLFQEDEPAVHKADQRLESLIREIQSGFMKPHAVKNKLPSEVKHSVIYDQKSNDELMIGDGAKSYLKRHKISTSTLTVFYNSVREYYMELLNYIKGPLRDKINVKLLKAAAVADTTRLANSSFRSIEYFMEQFPALQKNFKIDQLQHEFNMLQAADDLPEFLTKDTLTKKCNRTAADVNIPVDKPVQERQDKRWVYLGKVVSWHWGAPLLKHK